MAINITKQYQFIKFLGSSNLLLSSLPTNIVAQIELIYGIVSDGSSYLSWSNSDFSSLQRLETYKTYLVISKSSNPNYALYSDAEVVDNSLSTEIIYPRAMEIYRGSTPLTLSSASFRNNIVSIYGISSNGSAFVSYSPSSQFNSLTSLQPDVGYEFITNGTPFTLWTAPPPSPTPTTTPTQTVTPTVTTTSSVTPTVTRTQTATPTATITQTATPTATITQTATPTPTLTPTTTPDVCDTLVGDNSFTFGNSDVIGKRYKGGYIAGYIKDPANSSNGWVVIVAGKEKESQAQLALNALDTVLSDSLSLYDGLSNMNIVKQRDNTLNSYPAFDYCDSVAQSNYNGFNDWYLPSWAELELVYRTFKPTSTANYSINNNGANDYSFPFGAGYTNANPGQTLCRSWRDGGVQAMDSSISMSYFTSSPTTNKINPLIISMSNGSTRYDSPATNTLFVRPVRREYMPTNITPTPTKTQTPTPTVTPTITTTATVTPTVTRTATQTVTPTVTPTLTVTPTVTTTATQTVTPTITATSTVTPTTTATSTVTPTITRTATQTVTPSITLTSTVTPTITLTPTPTTSISDIPNFANYNNQAIFKNVSNVSTVGTNGAPSFYGCYDLSGNIAEWVGQGSNTSIRGGNFSSSLNGISKYGREPASATASDSATGFRIATSGVNGDNLSLGNFVLIEDINNVSDIETGYGYVPYTYQIAKFPITNDEYCAFLNSQAKTDTRALYNSAMTQDSERGGIVRAGSPTAYYYVSKMNFGNKPVNYVNWIDCARYCNWLHNGATDTSDTETGSYTINALNSVNINSGAKYWIPSENEWYKAAFYNRSSDSYSLYANQKNTAPASATLNANADGPFAPVSSFDSGYILAVDASKIMIMDNSNPSSINNITDINTLPSNVVVGPYREDAFVSNSAGLVDIISLTAQNPSTWAKVQSVASGLDSRKLVISEDGSRLYCLNYADKTITVYNLAGSPKYATRAILDYRAYGNAYDFCNGENSNTIYVTCSHGYVVKTIITGSTYDHNSYYFVHGWSQPSTITFVKNNLYVSLVSVSNSIRNRNITNNVDATISIIGLSNNTTGSIINLSNVVLSNDSFNKYMVLYGLNTSLNTDVIYYYSPIYNRPLSISYKNYTSSTYRNLIHNKDLSYTFADNKLITFDSSNKYFRSSTTISSIFNSSLIIDADFKSSVAIPAPSPSPTPTITTTPTLTPTQTATQTPTATVTPSLTSSPTPTPSSEAPVVYSSSMVAAAGANDVGQLGDGSYGASKVFKNITAPSGNALNYNVKASSLGSHNLIIDSNNRLWGWGNNDRGQVGPSSWSTVAPSGDTLNINPSTIAYDSVSNKYAIFGLNSNVVNMSTNGSVWTNATIGSIQTPLNWTTSIGWNSNSSTGGGSALTNQYSVFGLANNSNILAVYSNSTNSWSTITLSASATRNWTSMVQARNRIFAFASNSNNVLAITPGSNASIEAFNISLGLGSLSVFWKSAAVNSNGSTILAVGYNSRTVVRSIDSGSSWSATGIALPATAQWEEIICFNNRWILIASNLDSVYTSDDNGVTWIERQTGVVNPAWTQISIYNNTVILVGLNNSYYLTSTNNGTSWNKRFLGV